MIEVILDTRRGDAYLNGTVDFTDFGFLGASYGGPGGWADGDFDGNGQVNFTDFGFIGANYGWSR